jgi:hypothetical protein
VYVIFQKNASIYLAGGCADASTIFINSVAGPEAWSGTLLNVSASWSGISGAEGDVYIHDSAFGIGGNLRPAFYGIGTDDLHQDGAIAAMVLSFAVNLYFQPGARGIHDGVGAIPEVGAKNGVLFKFLFRDAFFADLGRRRPGTILFHHGFYASALLGSHFGERVGRDGHAGHGMSRGSFPETFLDVKARACVGGPEG